MYYLFQITGYFLQLAGYFSHFRKNEGWMCYTVTLMSYEFSKGFKLER